MKIHVLFVIITFLISVYTIRVDPQNSMFVDQYGRISVFHGVNVVYKTYPFHPDLKIFSSNYSLTDHDLLNLKNWGMNVIRLHVAWQGVQPQKGIYNYTYVQVIKQIVKNCANFGISVLLDAHQDLFVKQFCGQGLPTWVAKRQSFPAPLKVNITYDQKGFPLRQDCLKIPFAQYYMTFDVMKLQKDLFTNQRGLLDHLCKFWEIVAAYLSGQPNLIGYQFINQPIGANIFTNPSDFILPGQSNNKILLPAYRKIYKSIRKNDKKTPIFFQPSIFDIFAGGFIDTPGGEEQRSLQVFSYHIYCPYVTKLGQPVSTQFCQVFDALQIASKQQNIIDLKTGGFLTQYGALSGTQKSAEEITTIGDLTQMHFRSWTYWQFKYYNDLTTMANPATTQSFYDQYGNLQLKKVKALARPYAYSICGKAIKQQFKKGIYQLNWIGSNGCYNKNTQLFLSNSFYFATGFQVEFSKNCNKCTLNLLNGQFQNFYEVNIGDHNNGKHIYIRIQPSKNY